MIGALILTPFVEKRVAPRLGAIDQPRGRHAHERATPTLGGLAIFVAFWLAVLVCGRPLSGAEVGMLVGSLILLPICLIDDVKGLNPAPRLLGQIIVASIAVGYGVRIEGLTIPFAGHLASWFSVGWGSAPLTVFWIVLIINAINWLDGLDGLAAGVAAIAALTLAIMAVSMQQPVGVVAAALVGACLGFLWYNFSPARIYMGDTGAMFIGFVLACVSVTGTFKSATAIAVFAPLLVLGVPLYDVVSTVWRRVREGKSPMAADRAHLHYRLVDRGLSRKQAVLLMYAMTGALCSLALGLWWMR
jgi:UDP-GlcNAc:undecaprenyl-phosphate/decaprenyl-phosphate GlcNAc-1-phosphate transferase